MRITCIIAICAMPGAGSGSLCAESLFDRGCLLQDQGRFQDAEQAYRSFLREQPRSVSAMTNLGIVLTRQDRIAEAITVYRKALAVDPQAMPVRVNLALACYRLGDWTGVVKWFGSVLERSPNDRRALQLSAIALFEMQKYAGAARMYERLLPSDDPSILLGLSTAYRELGRTPDSERLLSAVLERSAESPEVRYLVGLVRYVRGDYDAATESFQKAVDLDQRRVDAYFYWGASYFRQQKLEEAVRIWKRASEMNAQYFPCEFALGALLVELHEYADARRHLERACRLRPQDSAARFELGRVYFQLDNMPKALEVLKAAVASNPSSRQASFFLAKTYLKLGLRSEAKAEFERSQKLIENETTELTVATTVKGLGIDTR